MKKLFLMGALAAMSIGVFAQTKPVANVLGNITADRTFYSDTNYVLSGLVRITNNATLTIQAGTVVKGGVAPDQSNATSLIIDRDGKLNAIGTVDKPIIFTSGKPAGQREYGDWGGLVYFGNAPGNKPNATYENGVIPGTYGGNNPAHNQGTLKYARIEFAGYPFEANRELNSLTMCGVGTGTTISYVQCSYNNDDAFEWFGGTVNCDHLISYLTNDDDFDVDQGYSGKVQFGVSLADTGVADVSTKNGFEIDNDANGSPDGPLSSAVFSNMTVIGAFYNKTFSDQTGLHGRGAHIRRNSSVSIYNSVFAGWKEGIRMDGANTFNKYATDSADLNNNVFAGNLRNINAVGADSASVSSYVLNPAQNNRLVAEVAGINLVDPYNLANPNWKPAAGSPLLSGSDFTASRLTGFTQTSYVGAFSQNDTWAQGWTEWDPINADYDTKEPDNTSVKVAENVLNIAVYPNPTSQIVNVEFDLVNGTEVAVQIIDLTGRVVASPINNDFVNGGAQRVSVDLSALNNSVYFVVIKTADGVSSNKVVLNR